MKLVKGDGEIREVMIDTVNSLCDAADNCAKLSEHIKVEAVERGLDPEVVERVVERLLTTAEAAESLAGFYNKALKRTP